MEDAFLPVVIGVSLLAVIAAAIALATSSGAYDRIGSGGLSGDEDRPPAPNRSRRPRAAEEVRQLVEARNARRVARGEPPLDVDAEVSKRLQEL